MSTTTKTKSAPAADAVKQIQDAVAAQQATIDSVVKAGSDAAGQNVDKAVAFTRDQVEAAVKAGADAFKGYEDILQFGKDNVDALVKSSTVFVRGFQELSRSFVSLTQGSIEEHVTASKALLGAKTLKEVIDLSSGLAKSNLDKLVTESTKYGQLTTKLAEEALAPISGRVDAAVQKLTKTAV